MWPEIQDSLEDGEVAFDRPDLCARVFRAKLTALMDMLVKGNLLGDITYYIYTIEWQKVFAPMHSWIC